MLYFVYTAVFSRVQWKNLVWEKVIKWKIPIRGKNTIGTILFFGGTLENSSLGKDNQWIIPFCGRVLQCNFLLLLEKSFIGHVLTLSWSKKHFPCQEDFGPEVHLHKDPSLKDPSQKVPSQKDPLQKVPSLKVPVTKGPLPQMDPSQKDPSQKDPIIKSHKRFTDEKWISTTSALTRPNPNYCNSLPFSSLFTWIPPRLLLPNLTPSNEISSHSAPSLHGYQPRLL